MKKATTRIMGIMLAMVMILSSSIAVFAAGETPHVHSFGEWTITVQPTYMKTGVKTRTCSCGITESTTADTLKAYNTWISEDGKLYFMDSSGKPYAGWRKMKPYGESSVKWCYFDPDGVFTATVKKNTKNKWVKAGGYKFFFTKKKKPAKPGFNTVKGKMYYMDEYGAVVIGTFKDKNGNKITTKKDGMISGTDYYKAKYKTFVLVDISSQTIKFYKKGKLKIKSDVVTGNKGTMDTPTGTFKVRSKARNIYLTGPTWKSFVKYWMAFYGSSYGLHDAPWRSSRQFSNHKTYRGNGSHGCINLRPSVAKKLYKNVRVGTPVIVQP